MGNSGSVSATSNSSKSCSSCNSCSGGGYYFGFGKASPSVKPQVKVKGKYYTVYTDSKGKYYKQGNNKKYLPKGTRTVKKPKGPKGPQKKKASPKRKVGPSRKKPKGYYLKRQIKSPLLKAVKDKKKKTVGSRLSARAVFNELGMKAIGRSFSILQPDGTYKMKVLRLRQNGSPYFANNFGTAVHVNIPYNQNGLLGKSMCKMTGVKNSYPHKLIAPPGVDQPHKMSVYPYLRKVNFGA